MTIFLAPAVRRWLRLSPKDNAPLGRNELSELYLKELSEMVATGEISAADAERIASDLFEPEDGGKPVRVREQTWQSYLKGLSAAAEARSYSRNWLAE